MADVLLFHHALGRTAGIDAIAQRLGSAGHRVEAPDLFEGRTFTTIEDGVAHAEDIGFATVIDRGVAAADGFSRGFVTIGISLGVLPAQKLAQTSAAVTGTVLCQAAVPVDAFGQAWPDPVGLQIHLVEHDPWAAEDVDAARELVATAGADLHLYPGTGHLVVDQSSADWDPVVAGQILDRIERFLAGLDHPPA